MWSEIDRMFERILSVRRREIASRTQQGGQPIARRKIGGYVASLLCAAQGIMTQDAEVEKN